MLYDSELIWNLCEDEVIRLLPFVDSGYITFTDVIRHTLSKDYKDGDFKQINNTFRLYNLKNWIKLTVMVKNIMLIVYIKTERKF